MIDLGVARAGPVDRRCAVAGACVALLPLALTAPLTRQYVGVSYPLFAIVVAFGIAMLAMSSVLLWTQGDVARSRPLVVLAGVYAATAGAMMPYLLLYRGVLPAFARAIHAEPAAAAWLWLIWHALFALSPAFYVAARRWPHVMNDGSFRLFRLRVVVFFLASGGVMVVLAIWAPALPPFVVNGLWTPLATGSSIAVGVVAAGSIAALYLHNRFRSVLDLWLAFATVCLMADIVSRFGAGAFTVGWYVSRGYILGASGTLLFALMVQTARVYARLEQTTDRLRDETLTDPLTGLANRRRFESHFAHMLAERARSARALGVLMIDIDDFKRYNDAYGHPAGDECLRRVAQTAHESVPRAADLVARIGGEELVVVLADTDLAGAAIVAERIRSAIAELAIPHGSGARHEVVTVSVGIAAVDDGGGIAGSTLLAEADRALYNAKRAGRNRAATAYAIAGEF